MQHLVWDLDPVFFSVGPLTVHWYGVLFAAAILSGLQVMKWIFQTEKQDITALDNLLVYIVIGVIVGARLGHCFFYDPGYYFANPMKILAIWEGGLASHGGGLGAIIAAGIYSRKHQMNFIWLLDRLAICTALFGFFVRSANFVNSEILGTASNVPWAVVFSRIDNVARHPSQLYEAFPYLTLFFILIIFTVLIYRQEAIIGTIKFSILFTISIVMAIFGGLMDSKKYLGVDNSSMYVNIFSISILSLFLSFLVFLLTCVHHKG